MVSRNGVWDGQRGEAQAWQWRAGGGGAVCGPSLGNKVPALCATTSLQPRGWPAGPVPGGQSRPCSSCGHRVGARGVAM